MLGAPARRRRAHGRSVLPALSARRRARRRAADQRRSRPSRYGDVGSAAPAAPRSRSSPSARWCSRRSPPPTTLAAEGLDVTVVNCRYLKPYDEVTLAAILADHRHVLVVEEGTVVNGFGAFMSPVIGAMRSGGARRRARRARSHHRRGVARPAARARAGSTRPASPSACARCTRARRSPGDPTRRRRHLGYPAGCRRRAADADDRSGAPRSSSDCCSCSSDELRFDVARPTSDDAGSKMPAPSIDALAHARRRRHAAARRAPPRRAPGADPRRQSRAARLPHLLPAVTSWRRRCGGSRGGDYRRRGAHGARGARARPRRRPSGAGGARSTTSCCTRAASRASCALRVSSRTARRWRPTRRTAS